MILLTKMSLSNEVINAIPQYANCLPGKNLILISEDMKMGNMSSFYSTVPMANSFNSTKPSFNSFKANDLVNHYVASAKFYSTNNQRKDKPKLKLYKAIISALLGSSGIYFICNVFLYNNSNNNHCSKLRSERCQFLIKKLHSTYKTLHDFLTLPYNSFVLLDKLQPVSKGIEKTLVLSLNKTLVSYDYSIFKGFEVLARPGLLKFIQELGKVYEIVLFSNEDSSIIEEIANQIDPKGGLIRFKLGKEAMRYYKGKAIKDLNYLNRNLDNVIVVDVDPQNVLLHQGNTVIIPEFNGNGRDRELLLMMVFLKDMALESVKNVKSELEKYGHYKPYLKYYSSFSKYHKLLPKTHH